MSTYEGNEYYIQRTPTSGPYGERYLKVDRYLYSNSGNVLQVNPYTADYQSYERPDCTHPYWGTLLLEAPFHYGPQPPMPAVAEATAGLMEKWTQTSFNVGVALGEGRESAEMIISRLQGITKAAVALKHGSVGGALRYFGWIPKRNRKRAAARVVNDDLFGAWMEMRYGWIPFLSDIYEASQFLEPKAYSTNVRSSKQNTETYSGVSRYNTLVGDVSVQSSMSKGVSAYCTVSRTPHWAESLGLTDPASIAWELMPLSFVADWFLPIGDTIKANYVRTFMPITRSGYTSRTILEATLKTLNPSLTVKGPCHRRNVQVVRTGGLGSLTGDLEALGINHTTPQWDTSLKRLVDSTALANNSLKAFRR